MVDRVCGWVDGRSDGRWHWMVLVVGRCFVTSAKKGTHVHEIQGCITQHGAHLPPELPPFFFLFFVASVSSLLLFDIL